MASDATARAREAIDRWIADEDVPDWRKGEMSDDAEDFLNALTDAGLLIVDPGECQRVAWCRVHGSSVPNPDRLFCGFRRLMPTCDVVTHALVPLPEGDDR